MNPLLGGQGGGLLSFAALVWVWMGRLGGDAASSRVLGMRAFPVLSSLCL